jgi:hypothetical protein
MSSGIPVGWRRHNDYCIRRDQWYIAKNFVDGATLYVLHDEAGVRYGHWESPQEAADQAASMDAAKEVA